MKTMPFGHPAWIEINLEQFKQNIRLIQAYIGKTKLCIPIKANAYGHGLIQIAKAAVETNVDYLAVSCLQEGALLRKVGIKIPILVLGAIHEEQIQELLEYNLEFTIASLFKAKLVEKKCAELQKKAKIHIEVDTGMQRTGVKPSTAITLLNYLSESSCFEVSGVYSHFATADNPQDAFAKKQIQIFKTFTDQHIKSSNKKIICHLSNSGGITHFPEAHMDMVRPGLLAFGYSPTPLNKQLEKIAPFFTVKAKVSYFKVVAAGEGIGYGHTYTTKRDSRIVTIPIGYGDGFRRALSNRGSVLIRGHQYPIVGTICMDQCMVNIDQDESYVGDEVILIGTQGKAEITLNEIARLCDTIPYEILCGFNDRLPRFYLGTNES